MDCCVAETESLTKKYGDKTAVENVSLHVRKGDIYGLIGKNGAGKTTLMKLLLGLTIPDAGDIVLFGSKDAESSRKRIGSLIEAPALYKNETAFENMRRFSFLTQSSGDDIRRILRLVGLGETGTKKAGEFSLGMRQRLGIAIALLGNPEFLILDEPINGLDPAGIREIRDIITDLNRKGVTFMISSHLLDELGKVATNYGIMSGGILVEEITSAELETKCRTSLKISTDNGKAAQELLTAHKGGLSLECRENDLFIYTDSIDASEINRILVQSGVRVYELRNESIGLEDYFIERLGK